MIKKVFVVVIIVLGLFTTTFAANNVTFQVNMKAQISLLKFDPMLDSVVIRGDFNGWGGNSEKLFDLDGDSIYTGVIDIGSSKQTIRYKFVIVNPSKIDRWENTDDRIDTIPSYPWMLPVVWFEGHTMTLVTFRLNMKLQLKTLNFNKLLDTVVVRGSFNNWAGNGYKLMDANGDSIYTGVFNVGHAVSSIEYKFVMVTLSGQDRWEPDLSNSKPNRFDSIPVSPIILPEVWFHNDSIFNKITFQVNMSVQMGISNFDKEKDSVVVRGDFDYYWHYWNPNAYVLKDEDSDQVYSGAFNIIANQSFKYKFAIQNPSGYKTEDVYRIDSTLNGLPKIYPIVWYNEQFPFISLSPVSDSLQNGKQYSIKWNANFVNKVVIEYSMNNGANWIAIANDLVGSQGSYLWNVPEVVPSSSQCKVRVKSLTDPTLFSESNSFTMYAKVSPPEFSINGGTYNIAKLLTISSLTPLSEIRYTLDGTEPSQASILYSGSIHIDTSLTLKARVFKSDWVSSDIVSHRYTLKIATPVFNPAAGIFSSPQNITMNSITDSIKLVYTLDGSEPVENSNVYDAPILIDTNKILKAKAFKKGWISSEIRTGDYSIAEQTVTVNMKTVSVWHDTNFDGKESKLVAPEVSISYGNIMEYQWSIGGISIGNDKDINIELPTGTWQLLLTMTTDRGIVKKDSVKISVYAATASTSGAIESAVSQLNDNVYFVTSKGGSIYRIDSTGAVVWTILTGGAIQSTTCVSGQDNIYVGSNDTRLYSFDHQGSPRWDKSMGGIITSSPSTSAGGLIYVGISTGRMFALDEAGSIKWNVQTGGAIQSSASIDENGVAYFGSDDSKLYAVSPSGTVLWTGSVVAPIRSSPALGADSSIVFGSQDGFVYKIGTNGIVRWMFFTGGSVKASPLIGLNGVIYIASHDGKIYSLSSAGEKVWEFNAGAPVLATPSLGTDGSIYFGTMKGTIYSIDHNGILKWKLETGKPITAPMLVTQSNLAMVGDTLGTVYIMKIPENASLAAFNPAFDTDPAIVHSSDYEWWTFKGNNQRTGRRKNIISGVAAATAAIPTNYSLSQNYPNPFNPATIVRFAVPERSHVRLVIYNMLGQVLEKLVDAVQDAGYFERSFDASRLSSGLYFYRIEAVSESDPHKRFVETKRMVLMR